MVTKPPTPPVVKEAVGGRAQAKQAFKRGLAALLPTLLDRPEKEIELAMEMLVRAYDPCISCSTHMLKVSFER